jgi:uncharacterized protein (DUF427 family)
LIGGPCRRLKCAGVLSNFESPKHVPESGHSWCEFKGQAGCWSLNVDERRSVKAAWSYPAPSHGFREIGGYLAFYASRVDECWVDDECVQRVADMQGN